MGAVDKIKKMFRKDPVLKRRVIALFVAHLILGFGVDLLRISLFGNDPFSCMNLGFSNISGMSFGTCVILVNLVIIIPVFIIDRSYIQFGTLVNMFLFGPISDVWFSIIIYFFPGVVSLSLAARLFFLVTGVIILCFGASMYMTANLGMGPYDAIGWIVEKISKKKIPFKYARIALDSCTTFIGFIAGSIVGLGTLAMALGTGPLVVFFTDNVHKKWIYG